MDYFKLMKTKYYTLNTNWATAATPVTTAEIVRHFSLSKKFKTPKQFNFSTSNELDTPRYYWIIRANNFSNLNNVSAVGVRFNRTAWYTDA